MEPRNALTPATTLYSTYTARVTAARKSLGRPLTLTEKILYSHLLNSDSRPFERGKSILEIRPDRVVMQDATAQMALLQFISSGKQTVDVASSVHCDHLIVFEKGAGEDLKGARVLNGEIYDFLSTVCKKYGIDFWGPGSGIIHQVFLETYAFPGGVVIGTDSHTVNAGGLTMAAIGVGGADAVDAMVGLPWEVLHPKVIGVHLTGKLSGWTSPKDIVLKVLEILTCAGGTNHAIEYFGEGAESISATGKATIANMCAELGGTMSVFPYDSKIEAYLKLTGRDSIATLVRPLACELRPDPEIFKTPAKYYDRVIEIDLAKLEPMVGGPHSPDVVHPISKLADHIRKNNYPAAIDVALIGSCTNSSYEDIGRAAHVAKQALEKGIRLKTKLVVTPGSETVYATAKRDGLFEPLMKLGAEIGANACGPCIGQWKREGAKKEEPNSIVTSFNRNFTGRNDGNPNTCAFIASPELVMALACTGTLLTDPTKGELDPPVAEELPPKGFSQVAPEPTSPDAKLELRVLPQSERLQLLTPFSAPKAGELKEMPILLKVSGKCTTDHISPAGPWLRYRGHLEKISDNLFFGAMNAFSGKKGTVADGRPLQEAAKEWKKQGKKWVAVGDVNYGEGSSREHAAMSPRFLNCGAVIAKSFARIHETNLKKQGIVPLTFADPKSYDLLEASDTISLPDVTEIKPGLPVSATLRKKDGREVRFECRSSLTTEQIDWLKAGSALNAIRAKLKQG
ncbi:MAG: aconitate hydratase [Pseudomonadota bacterium]